jgi:hypothetical protein
VETDGRTGGTTGALSGVVAPRSAGRGSTAGPGSVRWGAGGAAVAKSVAGGEVLVAGGAAIWATGTGSTGRASHV